MLKIISKRVLSCVVILCLALSSLAVTAYSESEEPPAQVSQIKKVITAALAVDDVNKRKDAAEYLTSIDTMSIKEAQENIKSVIGITLTENDINILKEAFGSLTFVQKSVIGALVIRGYTLENDDFSKFRTLANRINSAITNDISNDDGTKFFITLLEQLAIEYKLSTVYDFKGDKSKIYFAILDSNKKATTNGLLSGLLKFLEEREDGLNKGNVDDFLNKAQVILNELNVGDEIKEFKAFLEKENSLIYDENQFVPAPTPTPTTGNNGGSNGGGGIAATPTVTTVATATPTTAATSTPTPTSKPTATPTIVVGPTTKQITSFSFKNVPGSKGVIFERIHTIVVKVPEGTDLKTLEPVVEFKGASIRPESGVKKNFKNPVFYTVTAVDKSKIKYVVMVETVKDTDKDKVVIEPRQVVPGTAYGPFGDIFGHWAEERIISMIENGAIAGYPDGSVKPDIDMTRAEVITSLIKAIGLEPSKNPKLKFADIKSIPDWAHGYIQVALDKGIVAGYPDNTYKANNKVTRSEFLVMAMKAFTYQASKNTALKFKDTKDIPSWALGYVAKAVETTIIEGYKEDNTIKPNKKITRAEVMTIIDKCITLSAKK
ncbi:S-layer homology domain-containing protein [Pseudobacteroides cellulosolvens]|uniref:S-layer domain-containing protein n=1 Tax=Pseudobacteroides cellulosolvens ATCC 35603 = DSM 2933 TaxID=398512 RepID=A0A0L6JLA1_9FIRM|nr:S-layer homology domain-containing protein [Pseudobacteroides cellulosolvens]KNY26606.1 S-layer domain-containing protein [Pseudobacteroides cellulosolvens ATCC 35603 = DSM 2933]